MRIFTTSGIINTKRKSCCLGERQLHGKVGQACFAEEVAAFGRSFALYEGKYHHSGGRAFLMTLCAAVPATCRRNKKTSGCRVPTRARTASERFSLALRASDRVAGRRLPIWSDSGGGVVTHSTVFFIIVYDSLRQMSFGAPRILIYADFLCCGAQWRAVGLVCAMRPNLRLFVCLRLMAWCMVLMIIL